MSLSVGLISSFHTIFKISSQLYLFHLDVVLTILFCIYLVSQVFPKRMVSNEFQKLFFAHFFFFPAPSGY